MGWAGERADWQREEEACLGPGSSAHSGLDGNLGKMQPGRLSPRGVGQSGRRRGVQAAAAPQPLPLPSTEGQPIAAPDGPSPAAREGDSLGRPDLRTKKSPAPHPITNNHNRAWRPIERPAWCDGHFQGPDREIDAPGSSFRLVSWTFEKPLSATARPGSKVPLKKGPSSQVRPFSMRCRRAVAAASSAAARRGSLGLGGGSLGEPVADGD